MLFGTGTTLYSGLKPRMPRSLSSERLWSGYVMPLAFVSSTGIKEAEPHLAKQLLYSGIVKGAVREPVVYVQYIFSTL